ncbi:MAG: P-loop NTPase, partial [Lachnospiraceae bacterium]|nr:P-loop NTPase [Lachnospiraceae bacterium]
MDQAQQLRNIVKAGNINKPPRPLARIITVTSGKGGVGKSNTAINLAIQFKKLGKRVIILDADFGLANIEIMFGAVPKHNLSDLIYQGKNIKEIITWGPGDIGFISGGSGIAGLSNLSRDYLVYIIQNLAQLDALTDIVIIDTGAGISDAVLEFLVASGEIILVTTPEPTSITDSYSLLKALNSHPRFQREYSAVKML